MFDYSWRTCRVAKMNPTCWKLSQSEQVKEMTKVPYEFSTYQSVCVIPDGFIITGGGNNDLCVKYDIKKRSWSMLKRMRRKRHGHGSICISSADDQRGWSVNSVLYIFGGLIAGKVTKSVDCLVLDGCSW